jgi:hypothetical protein
MTRTIAVTTEEDGAELLAEIGVAKVSSSTLSRIPRASRRDTNCAGRSSTAPFERRT